MIQEIYIIDEEENDDAFSVDELNDFDMMDDE